MQDMKFYEPGTNALRVVKFGDHGLHAQEKVAWPVRSKGRPLTQREVEDVMIKKGFTRTKPKGE